MRFNSLILEVMGGKEEIWGGERARV